MILSVPISKDTTYISKKCHILLVDILISDFNLTLSETELFTNYIFIFPSVSGLGYLWVLACTNSKWKMC
jgi:hypothetical protein